VNVLVTVEVVLLDVGNDRHARAEVMEAAVELARLGNECLALARAAAAAELWDGTADHEARVCAALEQRVRRHRGGG